MCVHTHAHPLTRIALTGFQDILRAWGVRKADSERTTTATASTSATLTRKDTLGGPPPVPPKDEAYSMGGIASPSDWPPHSASPVTPSSARSRLAPPPPIGTPTFYAEQTRRDPALCSSPGFAALHFAQSANQPLPPSATASNYTLPPSAAASVQSFASADPLVPAWRREWGEPVRRTPDADDAVQGYPPYR
ncbi:hypothetical protein AURDEDRAFT_178526 [Auricularia subglabra TFB-10046 SS5]|uniref:Uncharacterized protein n=1 Tax=Auricularia subglabra (strain TFB-10046 / SS5) TaxID=717982 RepID=J0L7U9_AURST|nr:hypothetical protein AURDEDRAFT_178526 [Auricularia subglabra TFB-10046 SS5]